MSMPKSLRFTTTNASKPATSPWTVPGLTPLNSRSRLTGLVTPGLPGYFVIGLGSDFIPVDLNVRWPATHGAALYRAHQRVSMADTLLGRMEAAGRHL